MNTIILSDSSVFTPSARQDRPGRKFFPSLFSRISGSFQTRQAASLPSPPSLPTASAPWALR